MAKSSKSVLIISDLHVGSSTAICTPEPEIADLGTTHNPVKLQKELYNVWQECIDELHQKPTVLVVNGEPCDGGNPKGLGKQRLDDILDSISTSMFRMEPDGPDGVWSTLKHNRDLILAERMSGH